MPAEPTAAEEAKYGTVWSDSELDLIVADYFAMLGDELARRSFVKSQHSARLMSELGRSHRSVEFKHQNISAVLEALGLPWILGYRPKSNYQNAIFGAIDRYLTGHRAILELVPSAQTPDEVDSVFTLPPIRSQVESSPPALERLARKFDPVQRDYRNRKLGKAGEAFVVDVERIKLEQAGHADLAKEVRWVADLDGDGAGYDVRSFEAPGQELLIEVKTTNGSARTPFFLTRTEVEVAKQEVDKWRLFRVHLFAETPRIFVVAPPLDSSLLLQPDVWKAYPARQ